MSREVHIHLTMSVAWWLRPAMAVLCLYYWVTGKDINEQTVERLAKRAVRVRW